MSDTEKFVCKLQECAHNREPITLFGTTYVPADDVGLLKMIVAGVEVENAKLRELAKTAWGCVNRHVSCYECRTVCCGCTLQSTMRELGIEVCDD